MKKGITKVLSILCLIGILACGFVPCITLSGGYVELLNGVTASAGEMSEENYKLMEQMLSSNGVEIDIRESLNSLMDMAAPLMDGQISIYDFYTLSENAKEASTILSQLPVDGFSILGDEFDVKVQELEAINEMISSLAQTGQALGLVSYVFLVPVALFGLLALAVIVRILLRLFNRRGLGVFITLLSLLNAAFMVGLAYGINYAADEALSISATYTNVPVVMVVCAIANCIIWAIGRGAKNKNVKEEPVESPVAPVEPVEATEDVVVEEAVEETTTEEEVTS